MAKSRQSEMVWPDKQTPPEGGVKAAKQSKAKQKSGLLGLQVTFAQRDMTWTRGGNLSAHTKRDLLNFTARGQKACSLGFDGIRRKIIDWIGGGFGFGVFCRSSHGDP